MNAEGLCDDKGKEKGHLRNESKTLLESLKAHSIFIEVQKLYRYVGQVCGKMTFDLGISPNNFPNTYDKIGRKKC